MTAGLAIYDTMQYISPDVRTIGMGQCYSMGSLLLAAGTKGKRYVLPNTSVMVHQPSGGTQGTASDIAIVAEEIIRTRSRLIDIYDEHTGLGVDALTNLLERDRYFDAEETVAHSIVDEIVAKTSQDDIK